MSDNEHSDVQQEERSQAEVLNGLDMSDLRKFAKLMGITSQRDWTKEDYVAAIQAKNRKNNTAVVFDNGLGIPDGHMRVLVHRDPTPGHANKPVHFGVNGLIFAIPRGLEVDVPKIIESAMKDAITVYTEQDEMPSRDNPGGTYKENPRQSYPYQVLGYGNGDYVNEKDTRWRAYADKQKFFDLYGAFPTEGELKEWKKAQMNKDMNSR